MGEGPDHIDLYRDITTNISLPCAFDEMRQPQPCVHQLVPAANFTSSPKIVHLEAHLVSVKHHLQLFETSNYIEVFSKNQENCKIAISKELGLLITPFFRFVLFLPIISPSRSVFT